eukprot:Hpha_TRINITY_DN2001_c0_g1::TRINITY_DN2001_c0_g1_i1::g.82986::m.82986
MKRVLASSWGRFAQRRWGSDAVRSCVVLDDELLREVVMVHALARRQKQHPAKIAETGSEWLVPHLTHQGGIATTWIAATSFAQQMGARLVDIQKSLPVPVVGGEVEEYQLRKVFEGLQARLPKTVRPGLGGETGKPILLGDVTDDLCALMLASRMAAKAKEGEDPQEVFFAVGPSKSHLALFISNPRSSHAVSAELSFREWGDTHCPVLWCRDGKLGEMETADGSLSFDMDDDEDVLSVLDLNHVPEKLSPKSGG